MRSKELKATRFALALNALVRGVIDRGEHATVTSVAISLGIDKTRLSRLLSGGFIAGSKTVAQLCSRVSQTEAAILLEAYLLDEVDTVTRLAKRRGRPKWENETLVTVCKVEG
jgi:hypothetical protein